MRTHPAVEHLIERVRASLGAVDWKTADDWVEFDRSGLIDFETERASRQRNVREETLDYWRAAGWELEWTEDTLRVRNPTVWLPPAPAPAINRPWGLLEFLVGGVAFLLYNLGLTGLLGAIIADPWAVVVISLGASALLTALLLRLFRRL